MSHWVSFEEASTAFGDRLSLTIADPDVRDEYDFSDGARGKYADRFAEGSNVVVLDPDVAAEFKTRKAVNDALRTQLRTDAEPQETRVSCSAWPGGCAPTPRSCRVTGRRCHGRRRSARSPRWRYPRGCCHARLRARRGSLTGGGFSVALQLSSST